MLFEVETLLILDYDIILPKKIVEQKVMMGSLSLIKIRMVGKKDDKITALSLCWIDFYDNHSFYFRSKSLKKCFFGGDGEKCSYLKL